MKQDTAEWHQARLGKITGSRVADLMKRGRKREEFFGEVAKTYMLEKASERLTGVAHKVKTTIAMEWGKANEQQAREAYEDETLEVVQEVGFVEYSGWMGCSPDGFVGEKGMIEIKCPYNSVNHLRTLRTRKVPAEYLPQIVFNMWTTGREWCDFVSFDRRFKKLSQQMVIIRVYRKDQEEYLDEMLERVKQAIGLIKEMI